MDIRGGSGYPSGALSNFAPHRFTLDGVECASLEGLLQSFKFSNPDMQVVVCSLVGKAAKFKGKKKKWFRDQTLYWRGQPMARKSAEYQLLLDRAYQACCDQSEGFRNALLATGNATLEHSIGKTSESETVLTRSEFCSRLTKMRTKLQEERKK